MEKTNKMKNEEINQQEETYDIRMESGYLFGFRITLAACIDYLNTDHGHLHSRTYKGEKAYVISNNSGETVYLKEHFQ